MDKFVPAITWGHGWYVFWNVVGLMVIASFVLFLISKALFGFSSRYDKKNKQKKEITIQDVDRMIKAAGF